MSFMGALSKTAKALIKNLSDSKVKEAGSDKKVINLAARMVAEDIDRGDYRSASDPSALAEMVRLIIAGNGP